MGTLALTMIVRDEEERVARSLRSVAPFVDEMIVVDTGSQDATPEIAAREGASVFHFNWCDDFAKARNFSLGQSRCAWNLVLDADEWIVSGGEGLRKLIEGAPAFLGVVRIKSATQIEAREQWSSTHQARLLPAGTRYEGRVHEQPVPLLSSRDTGLTFAHSGYEPEALARKRGRNEKLLLTELVAHPRDPYLLYQLGREYLAAEDFAKATVYFAHALKRSRGKESFRRSLVIRTIYALKKGERFEEAVALVNTELANWPESPDFFFTVADLYLDLAVRNPKDALARYLPVAELCWKRCLAIGEREDLDGAVAGRGSFMAAHNLANFYATLGHKTEAKHYSTLESEMRARVA